jgi:hypothetical protein
MVIDDTLIILKRGRLEDAISVGLEKKYGEIFKDIGDFSVSVDIELTDIDDYQLDDVADEVTIGVCFDGTLMKPIDVIKELKKKVKSFKGFDIKYDKRDDYYDVVASTQDDIEDLFDSLSKDGCDIKKYYEIVDSRTIKDRLVRNYRDYREERDSLEREYRNSVL